MNTPVNMSYQQQKRVFLPVSAWNRKPRVGIIGDNNFVQNLSKCFVDCELFVVDETNGLNIDNLLDFNPDISFISYSVKIHSSGRQEANATEDSFLKLMRRSKSAIVVCSTVTPDIMERMCNTIDDPEDINRFLHWPYFNKEEDSLSEFKTLKYFVLGGKVECTTEFRSFMHMKTDINLPTAIVVNPIESAYIKCAYNAFLGVKLSFMQELFRSLSLDTQGKVTPNLVLKHLSYHPDIGVNHTRVPYDAIPGFSGPLQDVMTVYTGFTPHSTVIETSLEANNNFIKNSEKDEEEEIKDIEAKDEAN